MLIVDPTPTSALLLSVFYEYGVKLGAGGSEIVAIEPRATPLETKVGAKSRLRYVLATTFEGSVHAKDEAHPVGAVPARIHLPEWLPVLTDELVFHLTRDLAHLQEKKTAAIQLERADALWKTLRGPSTLADLVKRHAGKPCAIGADLHPYLSLIADGLVDAEELLACTDEGVVQQLASLAHVVATGCELEKIRQLGLWQWPKTQLALTTKLGTSTSSKPA